MAGRGNPPEGTPDGVPGGGEEDYRSVVFDEAFISAAQIEEYSARERMTDHTPAVRSRRPQVRGTSRQALVLVLLIAVAFGTAIYMGVRHPYQQPGPDQAGPLRTTLVPLTSAGKVLGGTPAQLVEHSPAKGFRIGAAGVTLPVARATDSFSDEQVLAALTATRDFIVSSAISPPTLRSEDTRAVRLQLDPGQHEQFDQSLSRPADDGRHAVTGWLIRFDPAETDLADRRVRVDGVVTYQEASRQELEVTADHVLAYAVRPPDGGGDEAAERAAGTDEGASLFTVRRQLRLRFDRDDLRDHHLELAESSVTAGPLACDADPSGHLRPLLAGQRDVAGRTEGTDPYATSGQVSASLCGVLSPSAQPSSG